MVESGQMRNEAIAAIAKHLTAAFDQILEANTLDLEVGRGNGGGRLSLDWLKLTPQRLEATVDILTQLAQLPDPLQQVMAAPYPTQSVPNLLSVIPLGVVSGLRSISELGVIAAGFSKGGQ